MAFPIDLSKLLDPSKIAQTALNVATGGLSNQLKSLTSEIFQSIVQKSGQRLGLSDSQVSKQADSVAKKYGEPSASTTTLAQSVQRFAGALGLTGTAAADFERKATDTINRFVDDQSKKLTQEASDRANGTGGSGSAASTKGGALGVLARIAEQLGKAADKIVNDMDKLSQQLGDTGKIDSNNMSKYNQQSSELNALGQLLKILTAALDQTLKAIGDAASTLARK